MFKILEKERLAPHVNGFVIGVPPVTKDCKPEFGGHKVNFARLVKRLSTCRDQKHLAPERCLKQGE